MQCLESLRVIAYNVNGDEMNEIMVCQTVMSRKFRTNRKRPEAKQDISRFPEPGDGGDQVATAKRLGLDGAACG